MSDSLQPQRLEYTRLPCPSPSPGVCSNLCPLSQWCHPTISSSAAPFSFYLQSFPAAGSFPMNWLFTSNVHSMTAIIRDMFYWGFILIAAFNALFCVVSAAAAAAKSLSLFDRWKHRQKVCIICWLPCSKWWSQNLSLKGTLLYCWWWWKLVQLLWRTVWSFLKKVKNKKIIINK